MTTIMYLGDESVREIHGEEHTPPVERAWADTIDMIIASMLDRGAQGGGGSSES
jgi:hypothetical protein